MNFPYYCFGIQDYWIKKFNGLKLKSDESSHGILEEL